MWRHVRSAKTDPQWIKFVRSLVQDLAPKDYRGEAERIFSTFKRAIRYVRDPYQVEHVAHPWITLQQRAGDCDDSGTAVLAAFGAIGFPIRIVTVKADRARPQRWSHVYGQVFVPERGWLGADLTVESSHLGWEPPPDMILDKKIWTEPGY